MNTGKVQRQHKLAHAFQDENTHAQLSINQLELIGHAYANSLVPMQASGWVFSCLGPQVTPCARRRHPAVRTLSLYFSDEEQGIEPRLSVRRQLCLLMTSWACHALFYCKAVQ